MPSYMIIAQIENEISSAPRMPYFLTFRGRRIDPPQHSFPKIFFLYLWTHNLIKQNNNFSILKKMENPLLNPLN